jgi:hypothetical protein
MQNGATPNIIFGFSLEDMSNVIPILCIAVTIYISFSYAGMHNTALAFEILVASLTARLSNNAVGIVKWPNSREKSEKELTNSMLLPLVRDSLLALLVWYHWLCLEFSLQK